jgi:hypothetical protein
VYVWVAVAPLPSVPSPNDPDVRKVGKSQARRGEGGSTPKRRPGYALAGRATLNIRYPKT